MKVETLAWNVHDGFSDGNKIPQILERVRSIGPDVAFFSEAYAENKGHLMDAVKEDLYDDGYAVVQTLYDDQDGRRDRHGSLALVRRADHEGFRYVHRAEPVRLAGRTAIALWLDDFDFSASLQMVGVHLDDRKEETRVNQVEEFLAKFGAGSEPTVLMGDLNAMHGRDMRARLLRPLYPIARRLPSQDPDPERKTPRMKRLGSVSTRLSAMAMGTTMQLLEDNGFKDADPAHRRTWTLAQLDHFMLGPGVNAAVPQLWAAKGVSDHKAISTTISAR